MGAAISQLVRLGIQNNLSYLYRGHFIALSDNHSKRQ